MRTQRFLLGLLCVRKENRSTQDISRTAHGKQWDAKDLYGGQSNFLQKSEL